ncbi:histidinol-phosphatase [Pseudovibrio exalbescens]|uniref:Histidinol-phosphatase n=1 Tax=Pseudovibrio exalbescens TaxID=197461 RepID=A0A1U7JH12_9HYPH|nr:histidinol-phosphatase [Pseudovibrio exalbescens]OKL44019.1 histidinol-phosphatase [Pseudovibrio exalbescens]
MSLSPSSRSSLVDFLHELADAADKETMSHFRRPVQVDNKLEGGFDPVTVADRDAEKAIRALINAHYPEHGIIGEEFGREHDTAEHTWVLDPVDGTRAFITGIPLWGSLIGLMANARPVLGMLSQPYTGERFWGTGAEAWHSGPLGSSTLKTRSCTAIPDAIMMTTAPQLFSEEEQPTYDAIEREAKHVRYGTDCYGYAMVASGRCDAVVESGLQIYDIMPLIPIIEGAGGVVTNWQGGDATQGGRIVACGDPRLHEALLKKLSRVPDASS